MEAKILEEQSIKKSVQKTGMKYNELMALAGRQLVEADTKYTAINILREMKRRIKKK